MELVTHGDIERDPPIKSAIAKGAEFCGSMVTVDCASATTAMHLYWGGIGYPCSLVQRHEGDHWRHNIGWWSPGHGDLRTRIDDDRMMMAGYYRCLLIEGRRPWETPCATNNSCSSLCLARETPAKENPVPYTQVAEDFIQHYGPQYRLGLLIDDVERFVAASGLVIPAASGSGLAWAVVPGGAAHPIVCGDLVWVWDEDGRHDGRCGANATHEGACENHFAERESYRALSEAERCHLEREEDAWAL